MFDRRSFVLAGGSSLALMGAARPLFAQRARQGGGVVRRSARGMSANDPDLAAMRRAVARMKTLPQSDPRNWIRFADIHRNFCPHGNWYFLPWHRAYLLSFERVCQELSGKPDFALPYWNWTADRQVPPAFMAGDRTSNPLFHPRPNAATLRLPDDMVGGQVMSRIMASPDFEAFGSTRPRGQNNVSPSWQRSLGSKTELEFNPHDGVHQAVGGNMSQVSLSARDPLFYLHHANVDRLWASWNARGNANSPDAMWRGFAFNRNFVNADGSAMNLSVGQVGSTPALGYRYDDDNDPFAADVVWQSGDLMTEKLRAYREIDPRELAAAGSGLRRFDLPRGGAIHVATAENDLTASSGRPIGITVPLGRPLVDIVGPQAFAMRADREADRGLRRYVWAYLYGVDEPLDATTRVRVFLNCQELSGRTLLSDPSYATSLSFFGGAHEGHEARAEAGRGNDSAICVDLTQALSRLDHHRGMRADRLNVQLLPHCIDSEMNVANIKPRRVEIVIL
jgi:tyrosinase